MEAGEFLKGLTVNSFNEYTGIYTSLGVRLYFQITAKLDQDNNLVFFLQNRKSPLTMRNLFSTLMIHQN